MHVQTHMAECEWKQFRSICIVSDKVTAALLKVKLLTYFCFFLFCLFFLKLSGPKEFSAQCVYLTLENRGDEWEFGQLNETRMWVFFYPQSSGPNHHSELTQTKLTI